MQRTHYAGVTHYLAQTSLHKDQTLLIIRETAISMNRAIDKLTISDKWDNMNHNCVHVSKVEPLKLYVFVSYMILCFLNEYYTRFPFSMYHKKGQTTLSNQKKIMLSTSRIFIYSIKVVWVKLYNYYKYKLVNGTMSVYDKKVSTRARDTSARCAEFLKIMYNSWKQLTDINK